MSSGYECLEQLESDNTLSQGDVIVWEENQDFQSKAAVIVTADCDLAKGKHWGRITVVPRVAGKGPCRAVRQSSPSDTQS
jgi:hypothetical protein